MRLRRALYPSFSLQASIQLDLFALLSDGPGTAEQVAEALGAHSDKLRALMYILAESGLLTVEGEQFPNSAEADHYLVRGKASYMGAGYERVKRVTFPDGDSIMVPRKPE